MAIQYPRILEKWCEENFFEINVKKIGILIIRVGNTREMSSPNVKLKNDTLKLLDELCTEDEEKKSEEFKYQGVHMHHNGSWNEFLETKKYIATCARKILEFLPLL